MADELLEEQYEEYLMDYEAWGHQFFDKPLCFDDYIELALDLEMIEVDEEFGEVSPEQCKRRDEIERLMLTHECYFTNGPRVTIMRWSDEDK